MRNTKSGPSFKKLISGCSVFALCIMGGMQVMAQDQVATLKPASDWSLKSQAGDNGYCALSRAYDQGVVLTLGRNKAEEYSLAIDFQENKLSPSRSYPITLQPSNDQIRAYEMLPASARAIVVRLGFDDNFFNALEQSKLLKADVNGVKYNFNVPDVSDGQAILKDCLADLRNESTQVAKDFKAEKVKEPASAPVKEAPPAPATASVPPPPAPEVPKAAKVASKQEMPPSEPEATKAPQSLKTVKADVAKEKGTQKEEMVSANMAEMTAKPPVEEKQSMQKEAQADSPAVRIGPAPMDAPVKADVSPPETAPATKSDTVRIVSKAPDKRRVSRVTSTEQQNKYTTTRIQAQPLRPSSRNNLTQKSTPVVAPAPVVEPPKVEKPTIQTTKVEPSPKVEKAKAAMANVPSVVPEPEEPKQQVAPPAVTKELRALKKQNQELAAAMKAQEQKLSEERNQPRPVDPKVMQELDALKQQNKKLAQTMQMQEKKLAEAQSRPVPVDPKIMAELNAVKQQNQELLKSMQFQEQKLAEAQAKPAEPDPKILEELASLKEQNQNLARAMEEQNRKLAAVKSQQMPKVEVQTADVSQPQEMSESSTDIAARVEPSSPVEADDMPQNLMAPPPEPAAIAESPDVPPEPRGARVSRDPQFKELGEYPRRLDARPDEPERPEAKEVETASESKDIEAYPKRIVMDEPAEESEEAVAMKEEIEVLQEENQKLSSAMEGQEEKLDDFDAKDPEAESALASIREELATLRIENKKLYEEAANARQQIDSVKVSAGNKALQRIREYEKKLTAAQSDNKQLSREIEEMRRIKENGGLNSIVGDGDLEKATQRYNEAQREIKRLGMLLEQQRSAHRAEKAELEQMLFDPAVTEKEQRRRLAELELKLADAQARLENARGGNQNVPVNMAYAPATMSERVVVSPQGNVSAMPSMPAPEVTTTVPGEMVSQDVQVSRADEDIDALAPPVAKQPPQPFAINPFNQSELQKILSNAGISLTGGVEPVGPNQYRWDAGGVRGVAEIISVQKVDSLNQYAQSYIARAKSQCGGDFASLPSQTGQKQSFEMACVGAGIDQSSSVVFVQRGDQYLAIAHQTNAEDMDLAMDVRDRLAKNL